MRIFHKDLYPNGILKAGEWRRDFAGEPKIAYHGYFVGGEICAAVTVDTEDNRRIELFFSRGEVDKMLAAVSRDGLATQTPK